MLLFTLFVWAGIDPAVQYLIRPYKSDGYLSAKHEDKLVLRLSRKRHADKVRISEYIFEKGRFFLAPNNEGDKVITLDEDSPRLILEKLTYNERQKFELEALPEISRFAFKIRHRNLCVDFSRSSMIAELEKCDNSSSQIFEFVPYHLSAPDPTETEEEKKERLEKDREKAIDYPSDPQVANAKDLAAQVAEDPRNLIHRVNGEEPFKGDFGNDFDFRKFRPAIPAIKT